MTHEEIVAKLRERFGADGFTTSEFRDNRRVHVGPDRLYALLKCLKEDCDFDLLAELSAADYLRYPDAKDRYGVWYVLVNTATNVRLFVKTFVAETKGRSLEQIETDLQRSRGRRRREPPRQPAPA